MGWEGECTMDLVRQNAERALRIVADVSLDSVPHCNRKTLLPSLCPLEESDVGIASGPESCAPQEILPVSTNYC